MSRPAPPALTVRYDGSTRTFAPGNDVVVGRDLRADIRIAHPLISRAHLVLRFDQGRWVAIDNGSLNGMYVNNRRVPTVDLQDGQQPQHRQPRWAAAEFRGRAAPGRRRSDADPIGAHRHAAPGADTSWPTQGPSPHPAGLRRHSSRGRRCRRRAAPRPQAAPPAYPSGPQPRYPSAPQSRPPQRRPPYPSSPAAPVRQPPMSAADVATGTRVGHGDGSDGRPACGAKATSRRAC